MKCLIHGDYFGLMCPGCNSSTLPTPYPAVPVKPSPVPALERIADGMAQLAKAQARIAHIMECEYRDRGR